MVFGMAHFGKSMQSFYKYPTTNIDQWFSKASVQKPVDLFLDIHAVQGPQGLLDTVEAFCLGAGFPSEHLVLLQATKQSEAPIFDSRDSAMMEISKVTPGL